MSLFQTDPEDDEFLSEGSARSPLTNRLQHSQAGDVALQQLISGYLEDKDLSNCGVVSDLLNALSAQVGEKLVSEGIANFSSRRRIRALSVAAQKRLRKVCITSASSTLSSQIIKQFINCGIDVVAACSGNLDAEQANALRQLGDESRLSIVQCDWGVTGFCKVFDGCDTVIHSAWPVTKCKDGETDEASAIGHVINAMNAAITTTSVRHLILTSSTAAVRYFTPIANPAVGFTPDDWSDDDRLRENNMTAALRMLLAERAAWEVFSQQHSHQRTPKLRFSSICVARLVGPSVFPTENDRNIEFISNIIRGKSPPFIDPFHYVDVVDAAKAHFLVAQHSAQGRFLCVGGSLSYKNFYKHVLQEYPKAALPEPSNEPVARVDNFDCSKLLELGLQFSSPHETIASAVRKMREMNLL